ncbi:MAG: ABC transporter permease subunit, partial [Nitratireductor sp.]
MSALVATLYSLTALPFTAGMSSPFSIAVVAILVIGAILSMLRLVAALEALVLMVASFGAAAMLIAGLAEATGTASAGYYASLIAAWLLGWRLVTVLSGDGSRSGQYIGIIGITVPALFGIWVLILWECLVRGAGVPFVLLPPPSAIGVRIVTSTSILLADFRQTVLKAVLFGYVVGSLTGFLVAILADRFRFFANGLLPIGNMVSALPMIGIAPIMVIWFGFDWQSKAAVVIVMTFFPMLVNTLAGLAATGDMERDLMR